MGCSIRVASSRSSDAKSAASRPGAQYATTERVAPASGIGGRSSSTATASPTSATSEAFAFRRSRIHAPRAMSRRRRDPHGGRVQRPRAAGAGDHLADAAAGGTPGAELVVVRARGRGEVTSDPERDREARAVLLSLVLREHPLSRRTIEKNERDQLAKAEPGQELEVPPRFEENVAAVVGRRPGVDECVRDGLARGRYPGRRRGHLLVCDRGETVEVPDDLLVPDRRGNQIAGCARDRAIPAHRRTSGSSTRVVTNGPGSAPPQAQRLIGSLRIAKPASRSAGLWSPASQASAIGERRTSVCSQEISAPHRAHSAATEARSPMPERISTPGRALRRRPRDGPKPSRVSLAPPGVEAATAEESVADVESEIAFTLPP